MKLCKTIDAIDPARLSQWHKRAEMSGLYSKRKHFYKKMSANNFTLLTLGKLLSSNNPAIKRNATGILKQLQKDEKWLCIYCGKKKEEYEAMFCDKCWKKEEKERQTLKTYRMCSAQVKEDFCKNIATHGDYCKKHADMFPL